MVNNTKGHNGSVDAVPQNQMQDYLAKRFHEHQTSGRFPDDDAVVAKVNSEAERFDGKGNEPYAATCSCGWAANNPAPGKKNALSSLTKHYEQTGASAQGKHNG